MKILYKNTIYIFLFSYFANFVWEHLHSRLYVHYQGGEITSLILARAALFDAVVITILGVFFLKIDYLRKRLWLVIIFGVLFAVGLEWFALSTGRWAYKEIMPIIPFIETGLTSTIQLGLIAYMVFKFMFRQRHESR